MVGLVAGKLAGITAFTWIAVRLGAGRLPHGVHWRHITGMAALAGIGFTVSIFVAGLAYTDAGLVDQAKIGVLAASILAALIGSIVLLKGPRQPAVQSPSLDRREKEPPRVQVTAGRAQTP